MEEKKYLFYLCGDIEYIFIIASSIVTRTSNNDKVYIYILNLYKK